MADDSDIPPLEDMTQLLQKADAIRELRHNKPATAGQATDKSKNEALKSRAKVTKKTKEKLYNASTEKISDKLDNKEITGTNESSVGNDNSSTSHESSQPKQEEKANLGTQGLFGGMKKGFLFGGQSKQQTKPKQAVSPPSSTLNKSKENEGQTAKQSSSDPINTTDNLPYIKPSGNSESSLTMSEVQEAMSEVKGLLDSQDWITEDLLSKIEKNELLLKRFSDPHFMQALQEFQTNPQAAMAKYKGNTEVERFLLEFCGLLGNHFTNLGSSSGNSQQSNQTNKTQETTPLLSSNQPPPKPSCPPKIVELGSCGDQQTQVAQPLKPESNSKSHSKCVPNPEIQIRNQKNTAEIQELPSKDDEAVKKVLDDPKVMETLMDPQVMTLIHTLREDPSKGQRLVDEADSNLKKKIQFLVSKGLLQFQMH